MTKYEKDTKATAVVLYDRGYYYFTTNGEEVKLVKEVYRKIKVFDAKNFKQGEVEISFFVSEDERDEFSHFKALTHNGSTKTFVENDNVYPFYNGGDLASIKFAFPNIKDGSILEYFYRIESPFFFKFGDWHFQGELPKIYSEFISLVPGFFKYNRVLYGKERFYLDKVDILEKCFRAPSSRYIADCEVITYAMSNVPGFKEEPYMIAKKNYISRVDFELIEKTKYNGKKRQTFDNWEDLEKHYLKENSLERQLKLSRFFKSKIPDSIYSLNDSLQKAKSIYNFIKNHYTWNQSLTISIANIKEAYKKQSGNNLEINLSLINALKSANLKADLILISTRENGLPKRKVPVLSDFNYLIVLLTIGDEKYVLDATDKLSPFEVLPFRSLNKYGRVLDFKNGGYWYTIKPFQKNNHLINAQLTLNDNETLTGEVTETLTGYLAKDKREELSIFNEDENLANKERLTSDSEVYNYTIINNDAIEKPLKEKYSISYTLETVGNKIYLFPYFLQKSFIDNPFKEKERNYPIDIGYPLKNTYILSIDLNDKYVVESLPKNKKIIFTNNSGECSVLYDYKDNKINLRFTFSLNKYYFEIEEYNGLKEFFKQVVEIQTKEVIIIKNK